MHGITRTQFRRMRKDQKREVMIQWFSANYEDPAVSTPYESAEGGYQYIWGGPYETLLALPSSDPWPARVTIDDNRPNFFECIV
ncbi:hypothetical protein ABIB94_007871 [Bradyrhizobium sp. JR7.2]